MSRYINPIPRYKDHTYKMTLRIYPVAECGKDLQEGEPVHIVGLDTDAYRLKMKINELIIEAMVDNRKPSGECFVEMLMTKDGEYYDCDEQWVTVDVEKQTIAFGGM